MLSRLEVPSVSLVHTNDRNLPSGFASGCLMNYNKQRVLLSVFHAMKEGPQPALFLGWEPTMRRVMLRRVGGFNFLAKAEFALGTRLEDSSFSEIDFSYANVPAEDAPQLQEIDPHTGNILKSRACTIWDESAIAEPDNDSEYGFAGHTMPSLEDHSLIAADVQFCFTELRVCFPLSYLRTEGDMHVFRLPVKHPGHEYFRGCSGAPIIDETGKVVALVCKGDLGDSIIYGISLRRYQVALDIHTGRMS